ncbi:MAG TPA: redoxin domain-containing protein [Pirellulales bacterium]|nr:redoxin domain-containing protein [Pirellulales bacterium]
MQAYFQSAGLMPVMVAVCALLAVALRLRRTARGSRPVSRRQGLALGVTSSVTLLFLAWWCGLRETLPDAVNVAPIDPAGVEAYLSGMRRAPPSAMVYDARAGKFLAVGDVFPKFETKGWLNGSGGLNLAPGGGLTVIDVWNEECPVCHEAAPALVRLFEKYQPRGVRFLGLTVRKKAEARAFVSIHGIAWPNGYGAAELGKAAPQVFVVHGDRIVWHDDRLRYRHLPDRLAVELDRAIRRELSVIRREPSRQAHVSSEPSSAPAT